MLALSEGTWKDRAAEMEVIILSIMNVEEPFGN
jgi:hypothetical protein